jgi:hypothetical protein
MTDAESALDALALALLEHPQPPATTIPDVPFPLESFPPPVAAWLEVTANRARVPVSFVAIPFLAFTGALVGRQLALEVGPGWHERGTLWVALVAPTGLGKTPALAAAREPFWQIHHENWRAWYDYGRKSHLIWDPPRPPLAPLFVTSTAMPDLAAALERSVGLCLLRDELYGLIRAIDRRQGEDRQHFLALWSGEPLLPSDPVHPAVLDPVVSIVGGLQPLLLHRARSRDQDGFLERFLLVYPTGRMDRWREEEVAAIPSPDTEGIVTLLRPLRAIPQAEGNPDARVIPQEPGAAAAWEEWFNGNLDQHHLSSVTIAGFYRKLPSHLARIALVLHALWQANGPTVPLSEETMRRAIAIVEYLRVHEHRAGTVLGRRSHLRNAETAFQERVYRTLATLADRGGQVPRSRLLAALGKPAAKSFDELIAVMERLGHITIETTPTGGRPATSYRLRDDLRESFANLSRTPAP